MGTDESCRATPVGVGEFDVMESPHLVNQGPIVGNTVVWGHTVVGQRRCGFNRSMRQHQHSLGDRIERGVAIEWLGEHPSCGKRSLGATKTVPRSSRQRSVWGNLAEPLSPDSPHARTRPVTGCFCRSRQSTSSRGESG